MQTRNTIKRRCAEDIDEVSTITNNELERLIDVEMGQ